MQVCRQALTRVAQVLMQNSNAFECTPTVGLAILFQAGVGLVDSCAFKPVPPLKACAYALDPYDDTFAQRSQGVY